MTDTTLTYRQLWERSGWVAADLARHGIGRGDFVATTLDRSIELVLAMLGTLRAGAAYLPVDSHAPADRVATILADASVRIVIGEDARLPAGTTTVGVPSTAPRSSAPDVTTGGEDPCYLMYTSGSTGKPKGVIIPHRGVVRLVSRPHFCVVAPGDRCTHTANPAFDASTCEIWGALAAGGTLLVFPSVLDMTMDEWVALVHKERVDTLFLTAALFHTVARERPDAFGSVGNLIMGGEQLEMTAVRRVLTTAPPRRLINGYGPTEATTYASHYDCTLASLAGLDRIPIGYPIQDTSLHVVDDELRPVPPGETGELCIGGPGLALGYLGLPELTAERFATDPASGERLYRTGDLVRMLPESGALELLGRRDRQIKLRGFRIELEEIEKAATATGLCDAAIVEKVGDGPAAYLAGLVLPAKSVDPGTLPRVLSARLAASLPGYMVPTRWLVLDELRYSSTGKVDRGALLKLLEEPVAPATTTVDGEALGPLGETLRRIWQEVLEVPRAGPGDSFLDLGGNSVMAVQVATRIQQHLDLPVEPADILLADSLADLARRLGAGVSASS